MHSQNILKDTHRVQAIVTTQGDTLIQFKLNDAKIILAEILDKEIADSLVNVYMERDAININTIKLQISQIKLLQQKSENQNQQIINLEKILSNKDTEIITLKKIVEENKKEVKKQKRLKNLGFIGCVVLPILILIL